MKTPITDSVAKTLLVCVVSLFVTAPTGWTDGTVVAWGSNGHGQANVPASLTNVVAIAGGGSHSVALKTDGTLVAWGRNDRGQTQVPEGLSNVEAIAAGWFHTVVLKQDGTVVAWGAGDESGVNANFDFGQSSVPLNLSGVVAIAAGSYHSVALRRDGTVVAWGLDAYGGRNVPADLSGVIAIAAGFGHTVALKQDGTVVAWGAGAPGTSGNPHYGQSTVPPGLSAVAAIAAGSSHTVVLQMDGAVVAWGAGSSGQTTVPAGLNGVTAIAASDAFTSALRKTGSVVEWGYNSSVPAGLSDVVAIAAGASHSLALVSTSMPPIIAIPPVGGRCYNGSKFNFRPQVRGTGPLNYQWRKDGVVLHSQTNSALTVNIVQPLDAGSYVVVVRNSFGTVTSQPAKLSVVKFGAPEVRADGEISIEGVTRGDQSTISMSTLFSNGTIFYTTDGSAPDFTSTAYLAPLVITQTTTIRAIAYSVDFAQSAEDGPHKIQIVPAYALTGFAIGQGTIVRSPNKLRHLSGATVMLYPNPAPGWRFRRWQGDVCGGSSGATVVMDANKAVTAVFEQIPAPPSYRLTVTTAGGGTIAGNTGSPYVEGSRVTLSAQPAAGWQFMRWEGDASGTTPTVAVTMDRARNVQAVFGTTVANTVGGLGSLTLNPAQGPYPFGSTVWISARPNVGSYFAVWGSGASGRMNPLPFVVTNANSTVSALFAPLQGSEVNAYVNVNGEGTVSASPNAQPYALGTSVTLTATPSLGWHFVEWQGEASGTSPNATVVLNGSKTVTAIFEVLPRYTLSATTPGGGTISGNTSATYAAGDVVILTATPAAGWQFLRWEGDATGVVSTVIVTMNQARNVQAVFGTSLILNPVGAGTITLDPAQGPYPYGSTVRLTATPNVGLYFAGWGNDASGSENPLEFIVTKANTAICALFSPGQNTAPPTITEQPVSQSVIVGGDATFHVSADGASPFTYQWRKDGVPLGAASSSTLFLGGVAADEGGPLDVVVSNAYGSITSAVATLTVVFPPSITTQPVGQVVALGTAVTLSVVADGTDPFTYQWLNSTGAIPNATNASYTIDSATTNVPGDYYVAVANAYGTATSQAATLTVYVPVAFTSQPAQQVVPFKGTAVFSASASGYPAASYQWLFHGASMVGANGSSLLLTNVSTNTLGDYSVIAWNAYSAATSSVAMLLMSPSIRAPFLGATAVWGKSATLTASAVGSGELSYQWFKDGVAIPSGTSAMLMFPTVQLTDAGLYSVVVSSPWGSVTNTSAQLVVNPANISLAMYAGVTIDGVPGYTYGIQYTTDLRLTNAWVTVTNYTLSVPVETWIDMESADGLKRFYRVVVP